MRSSILASVLCLSSTAFAVDYSTGQARHYSGSYTIPVTECRSYPSWTSCGSNDVTGKTDVYILTFAEGYSRILKHTVFSADPLKYVSGPVAVQYRMWHHGTVDYVRILDASGKEGVYYFASRADDPRRMAEQTAKDAKEAAENGPAPSPATR